MAKPRESTRKISARSSSPQPGLSTRGLSPDHSEIDLAPLIDDVVPTRGYQMLPMVGLGGSAGGIPAMQAFFRAMPPDSGLVFVVILHLSSEHESTLAQVLQAATSMSVVQVNASEKVQPNCVYVIPPGKQLAAADGRLELAELPSERGQRVAVDLFFRTLADTHGPHSSAIVLSGADGDGAIGIKRVKERGGLTIAQDPDEAEHPGMPNAAIATGMVDWVLQVAAMPARLIQYHERANRLKLPPEDGPQPAKPAPAHTSVAESEAALREVLTFLQTRTARDFSYYKRATILRRIGRRLQVNGVDDLPTYLAFLRTHPGEAGALMQDMLISVTNFFRDREAFDALALQIPALFKGKGPGDSVRVWVPACATGEEAYSLAMLLYEHARALDAPPQIQIFATDLDEDVIKTARSGIYPAAITADVSEERLRRWFLKEVHGYRVRREVRELVLFALHDLIKDAPFSRLDLVSCRNLFIYLDADAQARAFDIFHFALRPRGRLFLGMSETVHSDSELFSVIDKKYRIYEQRPALHMPLPVPIGSSTLARSLELMEKSGERPTVPKTNGGTMPAAASSLRSALTDESSFGQLHYKLIERFSPPSLVVNKAYDIVHLSDSAGRFLQFTGGEPSRNLLQLVHPMLRLDLRAALFTAMQSKTRADAFNVPIEIDGETKAVNIRVVPATDLAPDYFLIVLDAHATVTGRGDRETQRADRCRGPPSGTRARNDQVAAARYGRAGRIVHGRAEGQQRRAAGDE